MPLTEGFQPFKAVFEDRRLNGKTNTKPIFQSDNNSYNHKTLRKAAETCYAKLKEIPCITCPNKPEGSMFIMVKLNLSFLKDIDDDMDFCVKLAKEESVIVLPGVASGLKNWIRITFAIEPSILEDGLGRIKHFSLRHTKKQ